MTWSLETICNTDEAASKLREQKAALPEDAPIDKAIEAQIDKAIGAAVSLAKATVDQRRVNIIIAGHRARADHETDAVHISVSGWAPVLNARAKAA